MANPIGTQTTSSRWWRRSDPFLVAVMAAAFVIRLVWCLYASRTPTSFGDPFSYLTHADELATGKGYVTFYVGRPTAYYPVGYPAILGAVLWTARLVAPGTTALQVAIGLNVVCGTATVAMVHALGRSLAGLRAGRIAAVLVAVFPSLILYTATAYLETVFVLLVTAIAWLLVIGRPDRAWNPEAGPGAGLTIPRWSFVVVLGALFSLPRR